MNGKARVVTAMLFSASSLIFRGCSSFLVHRIFTTTKVAGPFPSKYANPMGPPNSFHRLFASKKSKKSGKPGQVYRADRVLSNRGAGSRSECFSLLKQKRVYVKLGGDGDGEMVRLGGPSEKIPMTASLWIDGAHEVSMPPPLLRVYHKPKWVLSVMGDKNGRKNLETLDFISKMHPVGRLDYDTSGLLLFSSSGQLTQTLLHPTHKIEKEYVAVVTGKVDEEELGEKLAAGVETSMGAFPAQLVSVSHLEPDQVNVTVNEILDNLPPEYDMDQLEENGHLFFRNATELSEVRLVVEEGKHRMVRRILANSGHPVIKLTRERLGSIELGDLREGDYRDLSPQEEEWASSLLKKKKE